MIAPAGSELWAEWQPNAGPCDGSRRLWSLWDMVNFGFHAVHVILQELQLHLWVSKKIWILQKKAAGITILALEMRPERVKRWLRQISLCDS